MADKIRVGVIGVGFGANVQISGFQTHPATEVVAVCSAQLQRAHEAAQRFNIPHAFDDYRRLLELSDVDAVSIVTPPIPRGRALGGPAADVAISDQLSAVSYRLSAVSPGFPSIPLIADS